MAWCNAQKRTFLRQRIESRLAALLFEQVGYAEQTGVLVHLLAWGGRMEERGCDAKEAWSCVFDLTVRLCLPDCLCVDVGDRATTRRR